MKKLLVLGLVAVMGVSIVGCTSADTPSVEPEAESQVEGQVEGEDDIEDVD